MPQYLDENGNPIAAPTQAKVYLHPETGEPMHAASDLTDNSKGEGLYTMLDGSGNQIKVPYSKVTTAQQQGYSLGGDAQRFARDQAADPNRRGGTSFRMSSGMSDEAAAQRTQQIEQNMSAPMQAVAGMAKAGGTFAAPLLHVAAAATGGNPQDVSQMLEAHGAIQKAAKYGTIGAAAVPAIAAAPLATLGGVAGGSIGSTAGQVIGKSSGLSDNKTELLSDALGLAGGAGGALAGKPIVSALDFNAKKEAAGALLQSVAKDANKIPVELQNTQDPALRLMDWQKKTQLGPTVNKFLNRITNPKQGAMTYEEARDFYQVLGNLSADEKLKMPAPVKRDLVQMVVGLKQDIGNAADQVGHAADYYKGLGDYASAARMEEWYNAAKKYAVPAALGAAGMAGANRLLSLYRDMNR